jgi:hypothetical protein
MIILSTLQVVLCKNNHNVSYLTCTIESSFQIGNHVVIFSPCNEQGRGRNGDRMTGHKTTGDEMKVRRIVQTAADRQRIALAPNRWSNC